MGAGAGAGSAHRYRRAIGAIGIAKKLTANATRCGMLLSPCSGFPINLRSGSIGDQADAMQLTTDNWSLDTDSDKLREECGVVAIYAHPEASKLAYLSLYALQHRG